MGKTCEKGITAEMIIAAEAVKRGYKVAFPFGHDWKYDLIVERNGKLERIQCKYTQSKNGVVAIRCASMSEWVHYKYKESDIDWIAAYDTQTDKCYFIPSSMLGEGRSLINLRLSPTKNNQDKGILWAKDYLEW